MDLKEMFYFLIMELFFFFGVLELQKKYATIDEEERFHKIQPKTV